MKDYSDPVQETPELGDVKRNTAAQELIRLLQNLTVDKRASPPLDRDITRDVLAAIEGLLLELTPGAPLYAAFHDGQVHDPLGAGAYAFRDDFIGPILLGLANDEISGEDGGQHEQPPSSMPSRPIVFHAGAQPNNSPHCGTLVVFCYAFAVASAVRGRLATRTAGREPRVSVEITLVDTAPVNGEGTEIAGIQYQRSHRDVPGALDGCIADYREVLAQLSIWSGIPMRITVQHDFFSQAHMPNLVSYLIANHRSLGRQLSPAYGTLALRAACPVPGCHLAEKHGRLNQYTYRTTDPPGKGDEEPRPPGPAAAITFQCPHHGPHTIATSPPDAVARLEANAPARNLLRSMAHLLDTETHHVRVTGADYAGMYQETFLHRPLAAWSAATGLARGRTAHILYAPLVVDWSGAKLSKSLYVREGGYAAMRLFGSDGLCSYAQLKEQAGHEGLRRLWDEVVRWVANPRKLFRCWSVEYLSRVVIRGEAVG